MITEYSFQDYKEWECKQRQIFLEYPVIEEFYLEKRRMPNFNEKEFFEAFFNSRFMTETPKESSLINEFNLKYQSSMKDEIREEMKMKDRQNFGYSTDECQMELKNDGWDVYGTRGICWGIEMNSKEQKCPDDTSVKKIIDRCNWHSEKIVREIGSRNEPIDEIDYSIKVSKRVENVMDVEYTHWKVVPVVFEGLGSLGNNENIDLQLLNDVMKEDKFIAKQSIDQFVERKHVLPKTVEDKLISHELVAFYLLTTFTIKSFWYFSNDQNVQMKFRKVIEQLQKCADEKMRNIQNDEFKAILDQIKFQLKKALR